MKRFTTPTLALLQDAWLRLRAHCYRAFTPGKVDSMLSTLVILTAMSLQGQCPGGQCVAPAERAKLSVLVRSEEGLVRNVARTTVKRTVHIARKPLRRLFRRAR